MNKMRRKMSKVKGRVRNSLKVALSKAIPDSPKLRYLSYLPKIEKWRVVHNERYPVFRDRVQLYEYLNREVIFDETIDYLEFGVFRGESIRYWSRINSQSRSRFYGFDTFTGLPEKWENFTESLSASHFNQEGRVPEVTDPRVAFIKGLFQDTLPGFLDQTQIRSRLVINNDSDLYSSTLYVLTQCHSILVPGTVVIFDEFSSVLHEFRALEDYKASYLKEYTVLGATRAPRAYYAQVAIQIT